jgi:hypothetical protein
MSVGAGGHRDSWGCEETVTDARRHAGWEETVTLIDTPRSARKGGGPRVFVPGEATGGGAGLGYIYRPHALAAQGRMHKQLKAAYTSSLRPHTLVA